MLDSKVVTVGKKLIFLPEESSYTFQWEEHGFKIHCPKGAVSIGTEVAVTAILSDQFILPKDIVLVSAVYAITVSKPLLKPLVIELQHCVDLRNDDQISCLKFVWVPLLHPYRFSIIEGGTFNVGNRYGSIKRDQFCGMGIAAKISNGDHSDDESEEESETSSLGIFMLHMHFVHVCVSIILTK